MPMRLRSRDSESTEPRPMKPMCTNIRQGEGEDHTSEEEMAINSQHQQKPRTLDENILLNHPRLKDRAKSARRESGSLREYSRKRFQTVVALESQSAASSSHSGASQTPPSFSRPKTTGGRVEKTRIPPTPTNGPTKDGSILYNSKPSLLSSIRACPTSETPGRFDHLRGTSAYHPDIQHVLEKSNCQFRVGASSPCQTARTQRSRSSGLQDFVMLIPVTSAPSDVTVALGDGDNDDDDDDGSVRSAEWTAGPAWVEEQMLQTSTARSKLPKKSRSLKMKVAVPAKQAERDGKERQLSDRTRNTQRSLRTPSPGVPRVNLTELLPEEEDRAPKTRLNPAAAPQAPDNNTTLKSQKSPARLTVPGSTKRRPGSSKKRGSSRPNSARSDTSSVISSVSARSPRPLCWVDDVTISSDESLTERDASLQPDLELEKVSGVSGDVPANRNPAQGLSPRREAQQRGSNSPAAAAAAEKKRVVNLSKRINPTGAGPKRVPSANGKANKLASGSKVGVKETRGRRGLAGAVVSEGGDEHDLPVFPRFLCPSSESKSRQAAIKEWLAKTSFSAACRTVPLM